MEGMKTVGIHADNYKVEKFKKELAKGGFTNYTLDSYTNETSLFKVKCWSYQTKEIGKICKQVELHFKRSN